LQWTLGTGQLRETIEQQNNRIFKVEIFKVEIFKVLKIFENFSKVEILVDNSGGQFWWTFILDNSGGHLFWTILVDISNKHASANIAAAI